MTKNDIKEYFITEQLCKLYDKAILLLEEKEKEIEKLKKENIYLKAKLYDKNKEEEIR